MRVRSTVHAWTNLCCVSFFLIAAFPFWAQSTTSPSVAKPAESAVSPDAARTVAPADATATPVPSTMPSAANGDIPIGAGDLLEIKVFGIPDLNQDARVSGTGDISVALLGLVHVAGLTPVQAQAVIEAKLKDAGMVRDPHVTVFTKEYATQGVSVLGEVQKPGFYPILGARRLFDAVSLAGGTTGRAGRRVTITRRDRPDEPITTELTDSPSDSAKKNVDIYPGDTIVVSKAGVVYVVGDVQKPSGFLMDNNEKLSVLQAIALAGGANRTAKLGKAKVIRKTPTGLQEIPVPLEKILAAKADDAPLQAEDILFVPSSAAKSAAHRGLEAIVAVTTGLAIYRF